jgi:SM-20-related protein
MQFNKPTFTKASQLFIHQLPLLQKNFDTLIDRFIEDKVGIVEDFLSKGLSLHLKENLQLLYAGKQLQHAGTGKDSNFGQNKLFRSDIIYWLDRKHFNVHEDSFFDLMDNFIAYLNSICYTGITSYEFHYTLYETGSFYKKHIDQFQNNDSRKYSIIMYLNDDWEEKDGGELCIHHIDSLQKIAPTNGKIVFFKSNELAHEVLVTNKPRMSITGWLKA